MSSDPFQQQREDLAKAQGERASAVEQLAQARERVKRLDAEQAHWRRVAVGEGEDPLAPDRAAAAAALDEAVAELRRRDEAVAGALDAFSDFTDPRENLGRLSDAYPLLLFPVRLETRFKTVASSEGGVRRQLWVRIYPDTCLIDTFEPVLAEAEVRSAQSYWLEIWRAHGVEAGRRGAWRALVASHGSGRAGWILDQYRPVNPQDEPDKPPTDVVLVIGTETPLPDATAAEAVTYWRAVWLADGDAIAEQAARAALEAAVGAAEADRVNEQYRPFNLGDVPDPPLSKTDVAASVTFVVFPTGVQTTRDAWTRPAKVDVLPERFVLVATSGEDTIEAIGAPVVTPLPVSPDPSAAQGVAIQIEDDEVKLPDELRWLADFDAAVAAGMGIVLDLTPAQAERGIDRLLVTGVRLGADEQAARALLEQLIEHHRTGRSGFSIVAQGTPTNNTEAGGSGFSRTDDADATFDDRAAAPLYTPTPDVLAKRDGQWLAEGLGIGDAVIQAVHGAGGTDQRDARAMHVALWPATLGYFMDSLLAGVFGDDTVDAVRGFVTRYVSGRGLLPAIRVGAQPYGILPTTAFSRVGWLAPGPERTHLSGAGFLARLYEVVRVAQIDWTNLGAGAAHVGDRDAADPHRTLLDILGLHPASVEFHSRYARSLDHLYNHLNLLGVGAALSQALAREDPAQAALLLARRLGYDGEARPPILDLHFHGGQAVLDGGVVDDRPLSEAQGIREWTDDHRNYIQWLIDAATASLDALRMQSGFKDVRPPGALLYLLLRHALLLGYHGASYRFHKSAEILAQPGLEAMKREPSFVHVAGEQAASESRWAALYKTDQRITGSPTQLVAEHVTQVLQTADEARQLREQLDALELLKDASTARLERAFVEHLDCCGYRLDAWLLGIVGFQLEQMRRGGDIEGEGTRYGLYLGAYGWLENVRPRPGTLEPVTLPEDLAHDFNQPRQPPLVRDPANGGFVHAPSLDHATTAAVLRSGYLTNASAANPDSLSVNLSSRRVRLALSLLDGIRSGQPLGALLGYRFERGLHDQHGPIAVDSFIYALRKQFPLRADRLSTTKSGEDIPIQAVEARNVVDGLRLVEHVRVGRKRYPFGLDLPAASDAEAAAIEAEVDRLVDVHDALADLALAEGVHQAVRGNFDRAAATLASYTTGQFPPEPEVVRTPTTGIAITHRLGLQLDPAAVAPANATPRAKAEPAVNAWLQNVLPPLARIECKVVWNDPVSGGPEEEIVTMADLRLQPVDLLYLARTDEQQAMTELDDRVLRRVIAVRAPRPDAELEIRYLERRPGRVSVFELAPLIRALRSVVLRSRPLQASDVALHNEASRADDADVALDLAQIAGVKDDLDTLRGDLDTYLGGIDPLLADLPNRRDDVIAGIDGFLDDAVTLLARSARYGLLQGGFGFALAWRQSTYRAALQLVRDLVARWDAKLMAFDADIAAYDLLPAGTPDAQRFALLQKAERAIRTSSTPLPANPAALRAVVGAQRIAFVTRRDAFAAILDAGGSSISALLTAIEAELPITDVDAEPFTLEPTRDAVVTFAGDLAATMRSTKAEADRRSTAAQDALTEYDRAAEATARVQSLEAAAKAILGDDIRVLPRFAVSAERGTEWQNALGASTGGTLLAYLEQDLQLDLPLDEWLHGVAPVREKVRAWEQTSLYADLLGAGELDLTPIQLPFAPGDHWLALQFPPDYVIDGDRLLYTAHYTVPFGPGDRQCGLLLDEWTEVLPGVVHTTGVAFNFDRPGSEPPQSLLLVTSASWGSGAWQWEDLIGALAETLDLARLRAVEPVQLDATPYATFLPATVTAATVSEISIGTVLAANDRVYDQLDLRG